MQESQVAASDLDWGVEDSGKSRLWFHCPTQTKTQALMATSWLPSSSGSQISTSLAALGLPPLSVFMERHRAGNEQCWSTNASGLWLEGDFPPQQSLRRVSAPPFV